jgi:hypothetical protein
MVKLPTGIRLLCGKIKNNSQLYKLYMKKEAA